MGRAVSSFVSPKPRTLYALLDFLQVRAPLESVQCYAQLTSLAAQEQLASEPHVRRALAVGSLSLTDALNRPSHSSAKSERAKRNLLRYLIRLSTRPTPYGLFAGVCLAQWGDRTDFQLAGEGSRFRTRPDMRWLMLLVAKLEANPEVRSLLRVVANSAALSRAGRVFLAERVSTGDPLSSSAVSVRATRAVQFALRAARKPIPVAQLEARLLSATPGATQQNVAALITKLWEQSLLITDLRPPLTVESPARYVLDRLHGIPAAAKAREQLRAVMEAARAWDASEPENSDNRYRALIAQANELINCNGPPFQVDMALQPRACTIARIVGEEVARAAELLLRIGPQPDGPAHIASYRHAFEHRYGPDREVPLLELLDENFGLGPPGLYQGTFSAQAAGIDPFKISERSQTLTELALHALVERTDEVELDDSTLKRLETWNPMRENAPESLELYAFVAASSRAAIDAGNFRIAIGPNLGGALAGRSFGRFADVIGPACNEALVRTAQLQEAHASGKLWVELSYQPRELRSANVAVRPSVRQYEIALGVSPRSDVTSIPVDELVVGIREGRLCLRWPRADRTLVVTGGHMLNYFRAPSLCRFLAEVSRDGVCQLSSFNWGPVSNFPFLPRVRRGRIVLSLAQWRIDARTRSSELERWRAKWCVPRYVYLAMGDNRLLLDLCDKRQADELRRNIDKLRGSNSLTLTEVMPSLDECWVEDTARRRYMAELAVPLLLSKTAVPTPPENATPPALAFSHNGKAFAQAGRLRLPGSEWIFVKLYCGRSLQDDLIAGPVRDFAAEAVDSGLAQEWFFLRYSDPEPHVRLRFRGEPERLIGSLLPKMCAWTGELCEQGAIVRCGFDTYEREIERYGGDAGTRIAETMFFADSVAVADLLSMSLSKELQLDRTLVASLSVDDLVATFGFSPEARVEWYRRQLPGRGTAGAKYRASKSMLRRLLGEREWLLKQSGTSRLANVLKERSRSLALPSLQLQDLADQKELQNPIAVLCRTFVHVHLNRLLSADAFLEREILELNLRTHVGLLASPVRTAHT